MKIFLNDKEYDVEEGADIERFISKIGVTSDGVAIAIDYTVIPRSQWKETILEEGASLMMIRAFSGG
ncbi:MAG: sulfur carrier protein ThiS [Tannerella sp.]|jgi:sulfur carrier protein|nr:sulfur carrier protein ThiS [Tannerella sp.]